MSELWLPSKAKSRSISAENPNGIKGGGAEAEPAKDSPAHLLGRGWKARPCISISSGERVVIADIKGPGIINHIWLTLDKRFYQTSLLRMYWDDEKEPSVQVQLGDFFCCGHGEPCSINSLMIAVNPEGGLNSFWPMPFKKSARLTLENGSAELMPHFFYQINYAAGEKLARKIWYFHALYNKESPVKLGQEYTIIENIKGQGRYVGTYLAWNQMHPFWWGEGEVKFFIDDDGSSPTICTTGTEDYFCGAWGFKETFSHLYTGYPYWSPYGAGQGEDVPPEGVKHGLYRWHAVDPVFFSKNLRVTVQALGWNKDGTFRHLQDNIASVAYWYQSEPHI